MDIPTEEQLKKAGGWLFMLAVFFCSIGVGIRLGGFSGMLIGLAVFFAFMYLFVLFVLKKLKKKGLLKND